MFIGAVVSTHKPAIAVLFVPCFTTWAGAARIHHAPYADSVAHFITSHLRTHTGTWPTISCPGTQGKIVPPHSLRAWCKSEWHTPQYAISISTSVAVGSRRLNS